MGLRDLPRDILFPFDFDDRPTIEGLLTEHSKRKVNTVVPVKGEKQRMLELASQNARHLLEERAVMHERVETRADDTLYELQEALSMKVVPRVIVCFDISHTQGSEVVGSGVVFQNGEPHKAEYRRFRIRGEWGNDDFQSMAEVVERYFKRRIEDGLPLPDLALIDGGKGQLGAAISAAARAGANDVTFASLAKREEEIYLVGRADPLRLPRTDDALRLLQRIRNEAHRFAITYNRKLRGKRTLFSELSTIPGIGPARQRALLEHFGSVRALRSATAQQIAEVPGFSDSLGRKIIEHLAR
jgi:excinuclease ABC subunit C